MTIFSNKRVLAIFCRFAVHIAHTIGAEPKMPESCNISQYQKNPFQTDYREKCNFFKKGQLFSNELILAISFAD